MSAIPVTTTNLTNFPYETIVNEIHKTYETAYAKYSERLVKIEERTKEWQKLWADMLADKTQTVGPRTRGAMEKTLWEQVDYYVDQRSVRAIKDILDLYDQAIAECSPPGFLPRSSVKMLERLDLDVTAMKNRYNFIFVTCLNQLKAERTKLQELYDKSEPVLKAMKEAGEPFAKAYYKAGVKGYFVSFAHSTYYFSSAVEERKAQLTETKTSEETA